MRLGATSGTHHIFIFVDESTATENLLTQECVVLAPFCADWADTNVQASADCL